MDSHVVKKVLFIEAIEETRMVGFGKVGLLKEQNVRSQVSVRPKGFPTILRGIKTLNVILGPISISQREDNLRGGLG